MSIIAKRKIQSEIERTQGKIVSSVSIGGGQVAINDYYLQGKTQEQLIQRFNDSGKYQIVGGGNRNYFNKIENIC